MKVLEKLVQVLGEESYDKVLTYGKFKELLDDILLEEKRKNLKELEEETK